MTKRSPSRLVLRIESPYPQKEVKDALYWFKAHTSLQTPLRMQRFEERYYRVPYSERALHKIRVLFSTIFVLNDKKTYLMRYAPLRSVVIKPKTIYFSINEFDEHWGDMPDFLLSEMR